MANALAPGGATPSIESLADCKNTYFLTRQFNFTTITFFRKVMYIRSQSYDRCHILERF